jgi:hypothetical protein
MRIRLISKQSQPDQLTFPTVGRERGNETQNSADYNGGRPPEGCRQSYISYVLMKFRIMRRDCQIKPAIGAWKGICVAREKTDAARITGMTASAPGDFCFNADFTLYLLTNQSIGCIIYT